MDIGDGARLVIVVGTVVIAGAVAIGGTVGMLWWRKTHDGAGSAALAPSPASPGLEATLRELHPARRWTKFLRFLNRTLPEWPATASLIEAARGIAALVEDVGRARRIGMTSELTDRLDAQTDTVAEGLRSLADRIAAADQLSSPYLRQTLAHRFEPLVRRIAAIRETWEGLAELALDDAASWGQLRQGEGRFQSLAATARDLHAWEWERAPG